MRLFSFLTTYCVLSLFVSCSFDGQPKPNIVWIVCEDISPYIGAYDDSIARTPNIDALAQDGVLFTKVYTTAGVCAPSRSSIITGMHQISIGTMHMRTSSAKLPEISGGYAAVLPDYVKPFPHYLREAGYYTTNNAKKDYQFADPVTVWDESSIGAGYQNRSYGQPFFAVYNFAATHESQVISPPDSLYRDPSQMPLPPFYQDAPQIRHDMAALYTRIEQMDQDVGELIEQLKNDGVYDQSYVIFFSDHGGNLPWTKRELLERGTHIPFVVKFPNGRHSGTVNHDLISAVDFAPSILSLAGISIPTHLQGRAFLGAKADENKNPYVFAARDRMDEHPERVRAVFDGTYRYVFNFHPEWPKYQDLAYRKRMASMQEILEMRTQNK
ncbi:MAG: sulfatase family protein, partial [Flavobacteriaceae bacterium]